MLPHTVASIQPAVEATGGRVLTATEVQVGVAALRVAQERFKLSKAYLFGKIFGVKHDYLVAYALRAIDGLVFPQKTFFAMEGIDGNFEELNYTADMQAELSPHRAQQLVGDLDRPLVPPREAGEEDEGEEATAQCSLTEGHLLGALLARLDQRTSVVPREAFSMDPSRHQVVPAPTWKGLRGNLAQDLQSFGHLREPESEGRRLACDRPDVCWATANILDSLDEDAPRGGAWAVRRVGPKVVLRSLEFPGYNFVLLEGSRTFGDLYVGSGRIHSELPFLL